MQHSFNIAIIAILVVLLSTVVHSDVVHTIPRCHPPPIGIRPVMPFLTVTQPTGTYAVGSKLSISWKGFLIMNNPRLSIELWHGSEYIESYPGKVYFKDSSKTWRAPLTARANYSIKIFAISNRCIRGESALFSIISR
ncbi:8408_t:CDS:2 [Acaulospora morrowiae]|uniref:8408_t:CDS:1 n=1 Tax=Acaulospora morrowiae TaxID=94023 RepID=A0A9N8W0W4_9GLOM|nr:8408_t:CDS:2 [Acaulospora morrowiae]